MMTKLEMLQNLNEKVLIDRTVVTLDDFFVVTAKDKGVTLGWDSSDHIKTSLSEVVKSFKDINLAWNLRHFESKWDEENNWYYIEFYVDIINNDIGTDWYKVEITLH